MPGEQNTSVNSASSVENQTSVHDKLERASDEAKLIEETPDTVRGQLAELFHALRSRDDSSRNFLLRVVQPGLAGVMGGSGFAFGPIFSTGLAPHHAYYSFLGGIAAATGAGIKMCFLEGLSVNCELTRRGSPVTR